MNDRHLEQNLERLLEAGHGQAARPAPSLRHRTLQRLSAEMRGGLEPGRILPCPARNLRGSTFDERVTHRVGREEIPKHQTN